MHILPSYQEMEYSFRKVMNYAQVLHLISVSKENFKLYEQSSNQEEKSQFYDNAVQHNLAATMHLENAKKEFKQLTAIQNGLYNIEQIIVEAFDHYQDEVLLKENISKFKKATDKCKIVIEAINYTHNCIVQIELAEQSLDLKEKVNHLNAAIQYSNMSLDLYDKSIRGDKTFLDEYFFKTIHEYRTALDNAVDNVEQIVEKLILEIPQSNNKSMIN